MLKKLTNCVSLGFEKIVDFSQNQMFELLSKRYPDINEVLEVLDRLKGKKKTFGHHFFFGLPKNIADITSYEK